MEPVRAWNDVLENFLSGWMIVGRDIFKPGSWLTKFKNKLEEFFSKKKRKNAVWVTDVI